MLQSAPRVCAPAVALAAAPPVSLGLPVFNGGSMLIQALDSVLAQTYGDFELIVSDNASTDDTPDVVRAYAARDRRIKYFRQSANIGSGNNWTFVARQSCGTWLKWISANDDYAPRLLEECLGPMRNDRNVVLCYGRTRLIDLDGNKLDLYAGDFEALSDDPLERYRRVRERLHLGTPIQAGVIRLDALRRCGYLGNYRDSDRVLTAGLALAGKFVLLQEVLFYRRWDKSVASALRGPLEVQRLYRPNATRVPLFMNLPRQLGQLRTALCVPVGLSAKSRAIAAAVRYTDWRRKLLSPRPTPAPDRVAGD
jgi:glycosyltransferase involved in cell wall biosynthesis